MSAEYMLGMLCGVLLGIILIAILLRWTKKRGTGGKCQYDERQQLVRGKGFQYAFATLVICNGLYAFEDAVVPSRIMESGLAIGMCVVISVAVYACYCIWNDGYFALNENPTRVIIVFGLIALVNILVFARETYSTGILEDGRLIMPCLNLCCGILLLVISLAILVKKRRSGREAEE